MHIYYAGIGSRSVPSDIFATMEDLGEWLGQLGFILRSGAALGADTAFETGANKSKGLREIFLPWKNFQGRSNEAWDHPTIAAYALAETIHPNWKNLSNGAKALIARNMHQILGRDLETPVKFVACWTPDGCDSHKTYSHHTGGTGTAIALASLRMISIFNLKNVGSLGQLEQFVGHLVDELQQDHSQQENSK